MGLRNGTLGLLERPVDAVELDPDRLGAAVARQGGTFLGSTNRGDPFAFPMPGGGKKDRSSEMIAGLEGLALDGLIGIGGDGSLDILRRLTLPTGLAFIGVPKTIDNDVANTERAIGYSTAVAIATGNRSGDGDMAGIAAHHLQHHDALMAGAGRLQAVERLGGDGDRRRIADGAFGVGDVVVDGLRDLSLIHI